jgi:glycerophosphoryl diester phosphodiesterase
MARRPLVLGHRGASAAAPENTLAAFARAREMGADGVELDVRRTADDVLVVHHDAEAEGVGVIRTATFSDLRAARPDLPTFDEALEACRGLLVNAEVKCLPWEPDPDPDGFVVHATIDAIARTATKAVLSSFDLNAVDRAHGYAPTLPTGWLTHGQEVDAAAKIAADHGHVWLNPDVRAARRGGADGIAVAHAAGLQVSVWTVDDLDDARALAAEGADILITNTPDRLIAALFG